MKKKLWMKMCKQQLKKEMNEKSKSERPKRKLGDLLPTRRKRTQTPEETKPQKMADDCLLNSIIDC